MLRYTALSSEQQRAIEPRDMFGVVGGIAFPFQEDFRDVLKFAIDRNKDAQVAHIKDYDEQCRARHNLPLVAYGVEDENVAAYMLRGALSIPHHDAGDIGVLQLKREPHSHITLWGESLKSWLHYGIYDFSVPGKDIKAELQEVVDAWKNFSEQNLKGDYPHIDIAPRLTHHDPKEFMHRYFRKNIQPDQENDFKLLTSLG